MNNATAGAYDDDITDEASADSAIKSIAKSPERIAKLKLIVERAAMIKLQREIMAGKYIEREAEVQRDVANIFAMKHTLMLIPGRAAPLCAHKSEQECEKIITECLRDACNGFSEGRAA